MTSLPGGAADKLGNRYEHWWTALRVADVLSGSASRIRMEPPGAEGTGIEFLIDDADGTWAEQVKDAPANGRWTLRRLGREGVLGAAHRHLQAGRNVRLVLSTDAHELAGLANRCRLATSAADTPAVLTKDQVADLQNVAKGWGVSVDVTSQMLRRIYVEHEPPRSLRRTVAAIYQRLFVDDPELVVSALRGYLEDHLHQDITAPQIWAQLESRGLRRALLVGDDNTINALRRTVDRHVRRVESIAPDFGTVSRPHADQLIELLKRPEGRQVVLVDGRAGTGKSTVSAEALRRLTGEGWHMAAARMDSIDVGTQTPAALGRAMDLKDSPAVSLAGVADGSPAVLVIDQLDAVSTYSGRMPDSFIAVSELLEELGTSDNVKVVLVARTIDIENDPRLRQLATDTDRVERFTVGTLDAESVKRALTGAGIDPASIDDRTIQLLAVPLHLAVFSRLSPAAREAPYRTLQELYEQYTIEARTDAERRAGTLDWSAITARLVSYMSDNEVLSAPTWILDASSPSQVGALESAAILVRDERRIGFFHETYFDFLFARTFVADGGDLHAFLAASGQHLFRRAQARQVLEHLASTDRQAFRAAVRQLLDSPQIRAHLREVVIAVLRQLDATVDDWEAIEALAWQPGPTGGKLLTLLSNKQWFPATDQGGRWEAWLSSEDAGVVNGAFHQLVIAARDFPKRASELVRPHIGESEDWRLKLCAMIQWSGSGLIDFAVELLERGDLDDARGVSASNSDFWSLVYQPMHDGDPRSAARLIGACLKRHLARARADGSADPFASEHLSPHSPSGASVITEVADAAPSVFLSNVLPFLTDIIEATAEDRDLRVLPSTARWGYRYVSDHHGIDGALFDGVDRALRKLSVEEPSAAQAVVRKLATSGAEELRFLACRGYSVLGLWDDALLWLLSDERNLRLGWSDSPRWATRELIAAASAGCSDEVLDQVSTVLLRHEPDWELRAETRRLRGRAQYDLLTGILESRRSEIVCRRIGELERKFSESPPTPPSAIEAHFVASPIPAEASERMSDDDWLRAFAKYDEDSRDWSGDRPIGGARELSSVLGARAKEDPNRFARLMLRFTSTTPAPAFTAIIDNVTDKVDVATLADLCSHAHRAVGSEAARAVCRAVEHHAASITEPLLQILEAYSDDPNPDSEIARVAASSGQLFYNGDLFMAGLNSNRGHVATTIATVLFTNRQHASRLAPIVAKLASDPIIAVRVCTAEAVLALLNDLPYLSLDLAEKLFTTSGREVFDDHTGRLLIYSLIRDPDRFGPALALALDGPDGVAQNAGRAWAVTVLREAIPASVPTDVAALSNAARRGAAEMFAANTRDAIEMLRALFDDPDPDVRREASRAMRHIEDVAMEEVDGLIRGFIGSAAFEEHLEQLTDALDRLTGSLPESAIEVAERAVARVGGGLGDIRTYHAGTSRDLVSVVLRLYRQGDRGIRARCLDVIDRLTEVNAYGVAEALTDER